MSDRQTVQVTCPECGEQAPFEMWTSINTAAHPEMKQAVRDRSAFLFKCPGCGAETTVDYGFLYQDPDSRIMIQYVTDEAQAQKIHEMLSDRENKRLREIRNAGFVIRLVRTAGEMAEKLEIFDAGLDDRIIELYKLSALSAVRKENPDFDIEKGEFIFYTDENGERRLQIMNDGQPFGTIAFNEKAYRKMEGDFVGILCDMNQEDPIVNRKTAVDLMKILSRL